MELGHLMKIVLFILVSASLFSTSPAGAGWRFTDDTTDGVANKPFNYIKPAHIAERILKVETKDYESYDPPPAHGKPPFKLIPN